MEIRKTVVGAGLYIIIDLYWWQYAQPSNIEKSHSISFNFLWFSHAAVLRQ